MAAFIEDNREAAEAHWLAIEDPATALNLFLKAAEFVHARKAAVTVAGEDGAPPIVFRIEEK